MKSMFRLLVASSALFLAIPSFAAEPNLDTDDAKTIYALGLMLSDSLKAYNLTPAELELLEAGLMDGATGKEPKVNAQEYRQKLQLIDDPETSEYLKEPTFFSGGGGLTSTIADYLRFTDMLRRGGELDGARILGPRTLEMMHMNHLKGGGDLTQMAIGGFSETANEGVGFGLGFASTMDEVTTGSLGSGDYYWGGAASTIFWVDPKEDLSVVFLTQLMPSGTFNFRGQLKNIIYSAIVE